MVRRFRLKNHENSSFLKVKKNLPSWIKKGKNQYEKLQKNSKKFEKIKILLDQKKIKKHNSLSFIPVAVAPC